MSDGALASCSFKGESELLEIAEREFRISARSQYDEPILMSSRVDKIEFHPSGEKYGFVNIEVQFDDPHQYVMFIDEDCTSYIEEK
ncbi:hypothetical protein [Donghicola mangrovi]|uniref:Uncharacterized protein n=1 Tax=Donghicola mangrovi TaxID=2729614 RepID=A0A850Q8S2_9RHOB|nr:hypothetical protein [Donghicola mangrovi]NVO25546.1 hypothetical protein [Donghicola mangrovi]